MTDDVAVRPIKHMLFSGDTETKEVALFLTDGNDEARGYAITPATLRAFLAPMINLAAAWSGEPDFSMQGLAGEQNALVARQILFARGRHDGECAVRVFLGKDIDFTFLLPIGAVMGAFQAFVQHNTMMQPQGQKN